MDVLSSNPPTRDVPGHKAATGCMLTVLPCCCSCADKRPEAAAYPVYIDGKGIRLQGKRWQRYCRKCHDYWQSLASGTNPAELVTTPSATNPAISAEAGMSPSHARYHNRYRRTSNVSGAEVDERDSSGSVDHTSTAAVPNNQHQTMNASPTQSASPVHAQEQVYPLGSREDVQQDDYESPLAGMFGRAYGRYREAETARQTAQANGYEAISSWNNQGQFTTVYRTALNPPLDPSGQHTQIQQQQAQTQEEMNMHLAQLSNAQNPALRDMHLGLGLLSRGDQGSYMRAPQDHGLTQTLLNPTTSRSVPGSFSATSVLQPPARRQRANFHRQFYTDSLRTFGRAPASNNPFDHDDNAANPIDAQLSRPNPVQPEDLKVDFACKVCTEQKINTVCMPCMHACMCRWCAQIHKSDCRDYDTGRWNGALWKCPICRKTIHEVKRFYV